jgi:hypothetical protein
MSTSHLSVLNHINQLFSHCCKLSMSLCRMACSSLVLILLCKRQSPANSQVVDETTLFRHYNNMWYILWHCYVITTTCANFDTVCYVITTTCGGNFDTVCYDITTKLGANLEIVCYVITIQPRTNSLRHYNKACINFDTVCYVITTSVNY